MKSIINLALIQFESILGDPAVSRVKAETMIREAAENGAELICLPELYTTGYNLDLIGSQLVDMAEAIDGPTITNLQKLAEEHQLRLTTFVDDVTISSQSQFKDLTPEMIRILERDGFRISQNKTSYKSGIVEITGVRSLNNSMTTTRKFKQKYEQRGSLSKATVQGLEQYRRRVKEISKS